MMENTSRKIKVRTVITRFKNSDLTLEEIAKQDYQTEGEKLVEYLRKHLNNTEFKKLMKANDRRSTSIETEDDTMKARPVKKLKVEKAPKDQSLVQVVNAGNVLANPRSTMENLLLAPKPSKSKLKVETKVTDVRVPKESAAKPEIMDSKKEEENMKQGENKKITLEELKVRKKAIEKQIEGQETEKEFKLVIIQSTEQERDEKQNKIEELKKQLATAEEDLLGTECELETLHLEISAIDEKAEKYRQELTSVEEQIDKASIVYLMAPSYRGHPKKDGCRYVAAAPGKGEGVEVDPYGEDLVDEMTRKELKSKAAEYGYTELERFTSDYSFVLLVKKYHDDGTNFIVKTCENAPVNELINKIVGKDVWNHD